MLPDRQTDCRHQVKAPIRRCDHFRSETVITHDDVTFHTLIAGNQFGAMSKSADSRVRRVAHANSELLTR